MRHVTRNLLLAFGLSVGVAATMSSHSSVASAAGTPSLVIPAVSRQMIVGTTSGWDDRTVDLRTFERQKGKAWKQVGQTWEGRLGAQGVSWGRGLHPHDPVPEGATDKVEGDKRAPAGVFDLGTVFGYAPDVARQQSTPYLQVNNHDLMVEDPLSPLYNSHVRLDHPVETAWEQENAMTLNDPAHELKIFVRHNKDPQPIPNKGSAILLHIQRPRDGSFTSGCTAMPRQRLFDLVAWLNYAVRPVYVLLPQAEYDRKAKAWGLPKALISPANTTTPITTTTTLPNTIPVQTTSKPPKKR
jgi:L,D-peptidoglycan transpeptidase YkuD (ErfK/YbiS/YcfS/YnhG family)